MQVAHLMSSTCDWAEEHSQEVYEAGVTGSRLPGSHSIHRSCPAATWADLTEEESDMQEDAEIASACEVFRPSAQYEVDMPTAPDFLRISSREQDELERALALSLSLSREETRMDEQEAEALALAIQLSKVATGTDDDGKEMREHGSLQVRPPCLYGVHCYRKNEGHRTRYSHPGDEEFDLSCRCHSATALLHDPSQAEVVAAPTVAS